MLKTNSTRMAALIEEFYKYIYRKPVNREFWRLNELNTIIFTEWRPGTSRTIGVNTNKFTERRPGMKRTKFNFIHGIKTCHYIVEDYNLFCSTCNRFVLWNVKHNLLASKIVLSWLYNYETPFCWPTHQLLAIRCNSSVINSKRFLLFSPSLFLLLISPTIDI